MRSDEFRLVHTRSDEFRRFRTVWTHEYSTFAAIDIPVGIQTSSIRTASSDEFRLVHTRSDEFRRFRTVQTPDLQALFLPTSVG